LRLRQHRTLAQEKVNQTLLNLQTAGTLGRMEIQLTTLAARSNRLYLYTPSLYQQAFEAINTCLEAFLSYESYIHNPENITELHAMRIAGKHLRYTLEIFAPIYGNALDVHIRAMRNVQELLGEIHDNDVWITWLPEFIEQERARIEDYFGHRGPLKRLLPGLHFLIEDRQRARQKTYQSFLATWETLKYEHAWQVLREIIKAPMNFETALAHLVPDADGFSSETNQEESAPGPPELKGPLDQSNPDD